MESETKKKSLLEDPLFSLKAASKLVGLTEWTLRCLISQGEIPSVKVRRRRMLRLSALEEMIKEG